MTLRSIRDLESPVEPQRTQRRLADILATETLGDRRLVRFWLTSEVPTTSEPRPVYPQQATFWTRLGMSQVDPGCVKTIF